MERSGTRARSPRCDIRARNLGVSRQVDRLQPATEPPMQSLKLIAATALIATAMAAPAMARNYCDTHRCTHRGPVGAAADTAGAAVGTAAGIAGAAIGTAGAIATAPFRDPDYNSYAYDYYNDPNKALSAGPAPGSRARTAAGIPASDVKLSSNTKGGRSAAPFVCARRISQPSTSWWRPLHG